MGTGLELWSFLTLLALLIGVSALAGAFWARSRFSARQRGARLDEQLSVLARTLERLVARLERDRAIAPEPPPRPRANPESSARLRVDAAESTAVAGPTLIAVPDLARTLQAAPDSAFADELARRFSDVWALADAGRSVDEIARETGQPIGRVELILGLRRQIGQSRAAGSSPGGFSR